MILNIPHSSKEIPADVRFQFLLSDAELAAEIIRVTDSYTDELFNLPGASSVVFPVSRLVTDPERFLEDDLEPMSAVGLGVVYTKTSQGSALRDKLPADGKRRLIDKYYLPHHDRLTWAVKAELEANGQCLIIDCHSFPSVPLPCELDKSPDRPDICIGTDEFHTPEGLSQAADTILKEYGFKTKFNSPYSGTIVPLSYYQKNTVVSSIMIEINRSLYMDEKTGLKKKSFDEIRRKITKILNAINEVFLSH